jgi:hypothetical protein
LHLLGGTRANCFEGIVAKGRGSPIGTMAKDSSIGGSLLRSVPKGMICLSAMGTREEEIFAAVGEECFDGMAIEAGGGLFI